MELDLLLEQLCEVCINGLKFGDGGVNIDVFLGKPAGIDGIWVGTYFNKTVGHAAPVNVYVVNVCLEQNFHQ